jgi:hypothetical protein
MVPARTDRLAAGADRVLDGAVLLLATWTVVYHLSLLLGVGSDVALLVELGVLVSIGVVARVIPRRPPYPAHRSVVEVREAPATSLEPTRRRPVALTLAAALVAAVAMALDVPWGFVWVSWLVAGVAGVLAVWPAAPTEPPAVPSGGREGWFVLACAVGLAAFSTVTLRPNPDDLYYVNLSQWVAEHGSFPVRDTIFADLTYPMSNWPPLASYDGLAGALAHVLGLRAGDIVYVVVPPVATVLAVLALWRLLRAWRVRHVALAVGFGLLFLLVDGTSSYGPPGNLFLTRLWQGKVILLCLLVPTLLTYALQYVERPTRRGVLRLLTGGAAAVACSTTAIFLVPVLALAGAAPLVRRAPRHAVQGFAAMAAYPVAAGAATLALGGRSADDFADRRQYRFDPDWFGHAVFLTDLLALVAVLAVLVGCLLVPHPAARLTTAILVTATGVTFVPGFTRLAYDVVGLGPTLWRITWGCTVAALVGAGVSAWWTRAPSPRVATAGAAVLALALGTFGRPIWLSDTSTELVAPPHWQRSAEARRVVAWIIDTNGPGRRVVAPDGLAVSLAVTTTDVKAVAPRDYYLSYLRDEPGFRYEQRLLLVDLVNLAPGRLDEVGQDVAAALRDLDVGIACVYRDDVVAAARLRAAGLTPALTTPSYICLNAG